MRRLSPILVAASLLVAACSPGRPSVRAPASPTAEVSPSPSTGSPSIASPSPQEGLRFAVIGDWGGGTASQRAVASRMCATLKVRPFRYVVTTGDNFYNPDGVAIQKNYWMPERCLLDARIVWRAAWGNHDTRGNSTATVLGSRSRWFAWSAGGVDFFVLDSNQIGEAEQRAWLAAALESSRAPVKVVAFHHPPYTAGSHPNNTKVQRSWVPLFERYDVTLVLNGHNHGYEHSRVDGIDYVVSGGGGASLYPCIGTPSYLLKCRMANHFLIVEVLGTEVTVEAITPDGKTLDRFVIEA